MIVLVYKLYIKIYKKNIKNISVTEVQMGMDQEGSNMLSAKLYSQDAGEAPHEDIGELSKDDNRNRIKQFITVTKGASDEVNAFKALNKEGFNAELFDQIKQAALKRYPKLNLFDGWRMSAQYLKRYRLRELNKSECHS
jgi:hypothetical protein